MSYERAFKKLGKGEKRRLKLFELILLEARASKLEAKHGRIGAVLRNGTAEAGDCAGVSASGQRRFQGEWT
jgi:hypothetical protein